MRYFITGIKNPRYLFFILIALICNTAIASDHAKFTLDIYRTSQITVQEVLNNHKNDIQNISDLLMNIKHHSKLNESQHSQLVNKIRSDLKKNGSFSFLDLSSVIYPNDNTLHITIDAVDMKDKKRLSYFIPTPKKNIPDPSELISQWQKYESKIRQRIFMTHQFPLTQHCPSWFCTDDFGDPALKKQISIIKQQVPKYQTQLGRVLNLDKNPDKRASAAVLLGYAHEDQALARVLIASMRDPNQAVRNNVNLVLSKVLSRITVKDFPVADTVHMLDFPLTTDRNKTLAVVSALSRHPVYARYYAKHAGKLLVASLKMQQPNLHTWAFDILKKISGQSYGERDYQKWERWAGTQLTTA